MRESEEIEGKEQVEERVEPAAVSVEVETIEVAQEEQQPQEEQKEVDISLQEEVQEEAQEEEEESTEEIVASPEKAADLSFCLGGEEEEEREGEVYDENEEEEVEEENVDPLENRFGGKLLGLATPTGQKRLFNSPAVTKSGQKIDEKYNVHWRYLPSAHCPSPTHLPQI